MSELSLIDLRMADGSRHFGEVAWRSPLDLKQRLETSGATVTDVIESPTESWVEFTYAGELFSAHNPQNDYWLFVRNPDCPDSVLSEVLLLLGAR